MAPPLFYNLINGREVASATGRFFENRNPADRDDRIGVFPGLRPGRRPLCGRSGCRGIFLVAQRACAPAR